ncbi:DUF1592 domain-containing protein [Planctomycetaceae bacterium SH139]
MSGSFPQPLQPPTLVGCLNVVCLFVLAMICQTAGGQAERGQAAATQSLGRSAGTSFAEDIQPLLGKYCLRCHQLENQESGVRVDQLSGEILDEQLSLLKGIQRQIEQAEMPPADEPQPSAEESAQLLAWISESIIAVRTRNTERHGTVRRLTVSQYRNTLRDLLGLDEDLTSVLPPDAISKEGFSNNAQAMILSPLQVESYLDIAIQALELCIVDERTPPVIQSFRMELGKGINDNPCPDSLILGANSALLDNADFLVTQPEQAKPFAFTPFAMRTNYDFIEGYQGNDTVRGWRKFDSIYHSVFACVRGTPGYPKGEAYEVIDEGLLLRPAIPSAEIFGVENTYGPKANFKISLRELPNSGNFRVRVRARRYDDALLLDDASHCDDAFFAVRQPAADAMFVELGSRENSKSPGTGAVTVARPGIYRVDVHLSTPANSQHFQLQLGDRHFSAKLPNSKPVLVDPDAAGASAEDTHATPFMVVRLEEGEFAMAARAGDNAGLLGVRLSRLDESHPLTKEFIRFENRTPTLGVHLGLRRDCGSTLTQVGDLQRVAHEGWQEYVFEGAINNFPSPIVEANNVNYLAGIREIGVRSEYTDGRDMPRLLVRSVEFEGPLYNKWPPVRHRNIFIDSPDKEEPEAYAVAILESFAEKAFRRPVTEAELDRLMHVWRVSYDEQTDFVQSIKDALSVVLTSPQFLFIIENSRGPQAEDLDEYELAAKLSYFLWNSPPDQRLLHLASTGTLRHTLNNEVDRMIVDQLFSKFVEQFTSEWLSLDKFDVVSIDRDMFPDLTREAKAQLRQEPVRFLEHLFRENLPVRNLVNSDFVMANEVVASYYGLADAADQGFDFIPVPHAQEQRLGGVLTQAAILAGLSNGRESNPIKRGAWLARKIIAEPPADPPPNVPMLEEDHTSELTLRQQLEAHRNQKGCVKCHEGIDPWGIPFEAFDAAGLFRMVPEAETTSQLPDSDELAGVIVPGSEVKHFGELQAYLATERLDQVAFSLMKHLATYATGRTPTYNEIVFLQEKGLELKARGYRTRDMLHFIINSDLFLKK